MTFVKNAFNPHANNNRGLHIAVQKRVMKDLAKEEGVKGSQNSRKNAYLYGAGLKKTTECTQCHRGMDANFGQKQIDNNREFAPICIPCCMGIPRIPLTQAKQRIKGIKKEFKEETKRKFKRSRK